jgi:type VI secretion system ImpM family protein
MKPVAFGKLPAHGDFVSRGLSPAQGEVWDGWFAGAVEAGRARYGDGFENAHAAAPAWRFLLGQGPLGGGWRVGAIAASLDSVGRAFFAMAGYEGAALDARIFLAAECAELALRDAIVGGRTIDALAGLLAEAAPRHDAIAGWGQGEGANLLWTFAAPDRDGDGALRLAAGDLSGLGDVMFPEAGP